MATKKSSKGQTSKKLESFNRTQEIYKLLEKGIIESEALLSTAADRPQDDAHINDLLSNADVKGSPASSPARRRSNQHAARRGKHTAKRAAKTTKKRKKR
ncbi:MAG: hypothetical protein ACYCO0_00045 [Candidatus Micrarchaeaceae archaeon]